MGFFKNEGLDYMDYTLLKKKGLLKINEPKNDVIDYTKVQPSYATQVAPSHPSDFGSFFGSVDASPSSNVSASLEDPFASLNSPSSPPPLPSSPLAPGNAQSDSHISALKIKLEDLEYKLEKLLERLSKIESKLGNSIT